jgi:hypothetical protein
MNPYDNIMKYSTFSGGKKEDCASSVKKFKKYICGLKI